MGERPWPYGDEAAARFVAAAAWPWERVENREEWAPKMLTDRDMAERTIPLALENLAAAIAVLTTPSRGDESHPASGVGARRVLMRDLLQFVAEHRMNAVNEEIGPRDPETGVLKWRTRVKCDGDSCEFYAEGPRYWDVVKRHDKHFAAELAAHLRAATLVEWNVLDSGEPYLQPWTEDEHEARSYLAGVTGPLVRRTRIRFPAVFVSDWDRA